MEDHQEVSPAAVIQVIDRYQQKNTYSSGVSAFLDQVIGSLEELFYVPSEGDLLAPANCYPDEYFSSQRQWCFPRFFLIQQNRRETFLATYPEVFSPWHLIS
ncbi:MAG: hypothetical protein Q8O99_07040 [bacterium]|nr:hypothetical protein [bacterium]